MSVVKIKDKTFKTSISQEEIQKRIKEVAAQINEDMADKNPGKVKEVMGINEDLTGRTIIIIEDIVDTGRTMKQMIESLGTRNPAAVHICALFLKPDKLQEPIDVDYACFSIPNDFIVGYGLDYDQQGRNLKEIYTLVEE